MTQIGMICAGVSWGRSAQRARCVRASRASWAIGSMPCPARPGYRLGSERGSPNHGSTLASKRVMARIWPPAKVST